MKRWRIYFNRNEDFPQIWSFDEGTPVTEVNVRAIHLNGATAQSSYDPNAVPTAWLDVYANQLVIDNGIAIFY